MAFSPEVATTLLVRAARCCCLCRTFKGSKLEIHHINQKADGGGSTADNGIPLCFDCHAEVNAYNDHHPRGRKYTPAELRRHRDEWFSMVASGAAARVLAFNPDVRCHLVRRVDERIAEGEAIFAAVQTIPGPWREKWLKLRDDDTHYQLPDRHVVDSQAFIQWAAQAAVLAEEIAAVHPPLARQMSPFANLPCGKAELDWGLATLRAARAELMPETRSTNSPMPAPIVKVSSAAPPTVTVHSAGIVAGGDVRVNGNVSVRTVLPAKPQAAVIPGTVSEEPRMIGYLRYLIERYHRFKRYECDQRKERMKYAVIYAAYKRELKYEMKHTPKPLFERAVEFLQRRIESTIVGKIRTREGQAVYANFRDFDRCPQDDIQWPSL